MAENIAGYLNKYRNLEPPEESVKQIFIDILESELETTIQKKHIRVARGVVYVDSASHIKNRIFVKKEVLLQSLKKTLGAKSPTDIR